MPNWCENRWTIDAQTPERVQEIAEALQVDGKFSFNSLIPMPEILKRTASGSITIDGENVRSWITETDADGKRIDRLPTETEKAQLKEIGASNWYEWANDNWGTKWDACNVEMHVFGSGISLSFDTAWGPPAPVARALADKFDHIDFHPRWGGVEMELDDEGGFIDLEY